jgi:hypothetical protein
MAPIPKPQYPTVNGFRYSFVSAEISTAGLTMRGYKGFNYKDSLEPGMIQGTTPQSLGWTRGIYTAEASFEMYRFEFEVFKQIILAAAPVPGLGLGEIVWQFQVTYGEFGQPVITDTLPSVRLKSPDSTNAQGSDGSTIKVDLAVLEPIKWNGVTLISKLEQGGF